MHTYKKQIIVMVLCISIAIIMLLAGCEEATEYPVTLKQVLNEVNERNKAAVETANVTDVSEYCFDVNKNGFSNTELKELFTSGDMTNVKSEQAKEDIDILFRLLETSYGGYKYFGGAKAFDKAKSDIYSKIDLYGGGIIAATTLVDLIRNNLKFVIDSHIRIAGECLLFEEAYCWYDNTAYEFHRDSKGYYTKIHNKKWYLPEDMTDYMKYTIGKSGEIVYGLFSIRTISEANQLPRQITLIRGSKEKTIIIEWEISKSPGNPTVEYELTDTDGIKTAKITSFKDISSTNTMINDAKKLAPDKDVIIDLRSNGGGATNYTTMWMYNFTGKEIFPKGVEIAFNSTVNNYLNSLLEQKSASLINTIDFYKENPELIKIDIEGNSKAFTISNVENGIQRTDYNTMWTQRGGKVLFVLNGKSNYSAGEWFVECCKTLENTLVVGTNSNGCMTIGGMNSGNPIYLPNSHISIKYGSELMLCNEANDFDKYGIMPDIYIGMDDAADAVVRCIKYYQ